MRDGMKIENLTKLKAIFKEGGSSTAGNSSQMTDGASCILLARRDVANKLGAKIYGRIVGFSAVGVAPEIMGIGPAAAIPAALAKSGLEMKDIDIFEINEAFASQACYCASHLNVPEEKLNPSGGAISLGHPLAMTGARMICTLFRELEETQKRFGLVSMCIGTGMGACGIFERE
jgi:acetyl-CoA acyltransferase 1